MGNVRSALSTLPKALAIALVVVAPAGIEGCASPTDAGDELGVTAAAFSGTYTVDDPPVGMASKLWFYATGDYVAAYPGRFNEEHGTFTYESKTLTLTPEDRATVRYRISDAKLNTVDTRAKPSAISLLKCPTKEGTQEPELASAPPPSVPEDLPSSADTPETADPWVSEPPTDVTAENCPSLFNGTLQAFAMQAFAIEGENNNNDEKLKVRQKQPPSTEPRFDREPKPQREPGTQTCWAVYPKTSGKHSYRAKYRTCFDEAFGGCTVTRNTWSGSGVTAAHCWVPSVFNDERRDDYPFVKSDANAPWTGRASFKPGCLSGPNPGLPSLAVLGNSTQQRGAKYSAPFLKKTARLLDPTTGREITDARNRISLPIGVIPGDSGSPLFQDRNDNRGGRVIAVLGFKYNDRRASIWVWDSRDAPFRGRIIDGRRNECD